MAKNNNNANNVSEEVSAAPSASDKFKEMLKKKKEALDSGARKGEGSSVRWTPREGTQYVRLLPLDGDPIKEYSFHFNIGKNSVLCLKRNFGERCPICEFASKSWQDVKDSGDDAAKEGVKKLFCKERYYAQVVTRGEEDKGARWWGFSKTTYSDLLDEIMNIAEDGEIVPIDLNKGVDFKVDYVKHPTKKLPGGNPVFETKVKARNKTSALMPTQQEIDNIIEKAPDYFEAYPRKTVTEVKALLNEWLLDRKQDGEAVSSEVNKYGSEPQASSEIDKAVNELIDA